MTATDLTAIVASLVPVFGLEGWQWSADVVASGDFLARVLPIPERRIFRVEVSSSCPPAEIRPSLIHELIHVVLSPLTAIVEQSAGAVMLEEQAVEALTLAYGKLAPSLRKTFAKALARIPNIRKRVLARTMERPMDGNKAAIDAAQAALDALGSGDIAAVEAALKGLLAALMGAGAGGGESEPPPMREGEDDPMAAPMREEEQPMPRPAARKMAARISAEETRARRAADSMVTDAIRLRLTTLRVVDGVELTPAEEAELLRMKDIAAVENAIKWLGRGAAPARGNSGRGPSPVPAGSRPQNDGAETPVDFDALTKDFGEAFAKAVKAAPPKMRAPMIAGARERKASAPTAPGKVN